jgi:N-acetylglucosaminyldiphosphoundecaprenol N-acetyl-beta-D-mannosaminyltransferase
VTTQAAEALCARYPGLEIACDHGFYGKEGAENDALIDRINASGAEILLVGMGTPLQEAWVGQVRDRLEVPVVWCLGATADFLAGEQDRGPAWLVERHEWLARLVSDPRRMWRRYLVGNVSVLAWACWRRLVGRAD